MNYRFLFFIIIIATMISCESSQDGSKGLSFKSPKKAFQELPDSILNHLIDGDIILRKGNGPLSFHLSRVTGEEYTHCGIIFKRNGKLGVIHTLGSDASARNIEGVQTQSLRKFVSKAADSCLFICRPIFKSSIGDTIVSVAKKYLELKIPFDYGFSMLSTDKFYCSELLYYIFKDVNNQKNIFEITKRKKTHILMFSTFFDSKKFTPLYKLKN